MKKFLALFILITITFAACNEQSKNAPVASAPGKKYTDFYESFAYVYGWQLGNKFKQDSLKINPDIFLAGLKEGFLNDTSALYSRQEVDSIFMKLNEMLNQRIASGSKEGLEKANKFLEENSKKEGVKTLESGTQYLVKKEGSGRNPKDNDYLKIKISGFLPDGKSLDGGMEPQATTVPMEALRTVPALFSVFKVMKPGSQFTIWAPPSQAYGERGIPERGIPGNTVVRFEIEFLDYDKAPEGGMGKMPRAPQPNQGQPQQMKQ